MRMGFDSEEDAAAALAAAVEKYVADGRTSGPLPQEIEEALHNLLYGRGSDGVIELSVPQLGSTCITIVGIVIWVTEQTLAPLEATFRLREAQGSVKTITIRAGDRRISRRDAPKYPQSWRNLHRIIAFRPTADEDWTDVLHYDLD